jgi:hypothetical protein
MHAARRYRATKWGGGTGRGTHRPPHVGNALTISAMLAPRVKHMQAPMAQHHTAEAGPPTRSGVLNVVAILEQSPCTRASAGRSHTRASVADAP